MVDYRYLTDYHVHAGRCDSVGRPEEYVEQAIRLGLAEVGFSEHAPLFHLPVAARDPEIGLAEEAVERYVEEILTLRARYPEIAIRLGIEADYVPGWEAASLVEAYPWDYVLGSVHFLYLPKVAGRTMKEDFWGIDNPAEVARYAEWDVDELYRRYFALVGDAAETGLYDIMTHVDLVKKFGHRATADLAEPYRELAERLGRADVAIEVSTAGLRKPVGEIYPGPGLLAECGRAGVPIVIDSDAHAPEEVGRDFDRAVGLAWQSGYREVVRLAERQQSQHPLPEPR